EVKRLSADDSVGIPHVKVGHCQDFIQNLPKMVFLIQKVFIKTNFGEFIFSKYQKKLPRYILLM
ncbi:MAG: hypothetical protein ACO1N3_04110, partial [Gammaproteobacteria bacterium]